MRTSCDQYKLPKGQVVNAPTEDIKQEILKDGGILWKGYDYDNQYWVFEGKRDTRTLEELQASIDESTRSLKKSAEKIGAKHKLIINSFYDTQAECLCGWHLVFTGEMKREEIEAEYKKHLSI